MSEPATSPLRGTRSCTRPRECREPSAKQAQKNNTTFFSLKTMKFDISFEPSHEKHENIENIRPAFFLLHQICIVFQKMLVWGSVRLWSRSVPTFLAIDTCPHILLCIATRFSSVSTYIDITKQTHNSTTNHEPSTLKLPGSKSNHCCAKTPPHPRNK